MKALSRLLTRPLLGRIRRSPALTRSHGSATHLPHLGGRTPICGRNQLRPTCVRRGKGQTEAGLRPPGRQARTGDVMATGAGRALRRGSLSLAFIVLTIVTITAGTAWGKMSCFSVKVTPGRPLAGRASEVTVRVPEWDVQDIAGPTQMRRLLRAYPETTFVSRAVRWGGLEIVLEREAPGLYRGIIAFPDPGTWVLLTFPADPTARITRQDLRCYPNTALVQVRPKDLGLMPALGEAPPMSHGPRFPTLAIATVVALCVAGGAFGRRRLAR
jgi:hypothetical protein